MTEPTKTKCELAAKKVDDLVEDYYSGYGTDHVIDIIHRAFKQHTVEQEQQTIKETQRANELLKSLQNSEESLRRESKRVVGLLNERDALRQQLEVAGEQDAEKVTKRLEKQTQQALDVLANVARERDRLRQQFAEIEQIGRETGLSVELKPVGICLALRQHIKELEKQGVLPP